MPAIAAGKLRRHCLAFLMKRMAVVLACICILVASGCDRPAEARFAQNADSGQPSPAMKIDSALPPGEALRRFQSELPGVTALTGAAPTRDDLVTRFVTAMEKRDNAALERLVVSKAEYGFLYFPSSIYMRKPYELPPDIAWLLSEQNSRKGFIRLTRRLAGNPLEFRGYECSEPVIEGDNRFWRMCHVTYVDPTTRKVVRRRLFGAIIESGGAYKFLSYVNDF